MYSIKFYRPSYGKKARYIIKVNTLSEVAAVIMLKHKTIECVQNLTHRETVILWKKCYSLEQARYRKEQSEQDPAKEAQTSEFYTHELCLNSIYRIFRNS